MLPTCFMVGEASRILWPMIVWRLMYSHSWSSSGPGLFRIASGIADLSEVVQRGGRPDIAEIGLRDVEMFGYRSGQLSHTLQMGAQVRIAFVESSQKNGRRLDPGAASLAVLVRVEALVGEPHRALVVGCLDAELNVSVGDVDDEALSLLRQRSACRPKQRFSTLSETPSSADRTRRRRAGRPCHDPPLHAGVLRPDAASSTSPAGCPNVSL